MGNEVDDPADPHGIHIPMRGIDHHCKFIWKLCCMETCLSFNFTLRLRRFFVTAFVMLMCASLSPSQTQRQASVSGIVVDDSTGAPLENVNVFVAQTTLGSNTGPSGTFEIRNIPAGTYDIVASCLGYDAGKVRVTLSSGTVTLKLKLKSVIIPFGEVTISATVPEEWHRQFERFRKLFIGSSPNAKECRILNPEVLDFEEEGDFFTASARAPLEIENTALGYHIMYLLRVFKTKTVTTTFGGSTGRGYSLTYDGIPKYTELDSGTADKRREWEQNRRTTYEGSLRHFLRSLYLENWEDDGFVINLMREPNIRNTPIGRRPLTPETIDLVLSVVDPNKDRKLHYEGILEVQYTRKYIDSAPDMLQKQGTRNPVSWLQLNQDSITFNASGSVKESTPTTTYGYWTWLRLADLLPLDYEPE
jgi:hypothetical protein